MGNVIKKLKTRLESPKIEILVYENDETVEEVITLDPMERFRFAIRLLRKEMKLLGTNNYFLGRQPSYTDLMAAAYETGIITALELDQVAELEAQIKAERLKLVSPSGRDLSRKTAEAERLKGELAFATDLYKATLTASERTRVESLRKQKFMAVLSSPQKPEEPWNDWRYRGFFTVAAAIIVGFALIKFILGMAESHRD
jgi:hypothetical protein